MLEDQAYILEKILRLLEEEPPDAVLIAGDVYDKTVPSAEAVSMLDDFLCKLADKHLPTLVISGNHDAPERLSFGARLMNHSGIHIAPVFNGSVEYVTLTDAYGPVNFYMLPFLKSAHIQRFYPDISFESCSQAIQTVLKDMAVDPSRRNVLIAHQFVTGAVRSESEEISVGGAENIDADIFRDFDYVALGHIHKPQYMGSHHIRYCGTPLKYSFSEAEQQKSLTQVTLKEKGNIFVEVKPLEPLRDFREIKGEYNLLVSRSFYQDSNREDYIHAILTDEQDIPNVVGKLRAVYPRIMQVDYDNTRTRASGALPELSEYRKKSPLDFFSDFYRAQNGADMSDEQRDFVLRLMEDIWETGKEAFV